jgi:hypothetical protein
MARPGLAWPLPWPVAGLCSDLKLKLTFARCGFELCLNLDLNIEENNHCRVHHFSLLLLLLAIDSFLVFLKNVWRIPGAPREGSTGCRPALVF